MVSRIMKHGQGQLSEHRARLSTHEIYNTFPLHPAVSVWHGVSCRMGHEWSATKEAWGRQRGHTPVRLQSFDLNCTELNLTELNCEL